MNSSSSSQMGYWRAQCVMFPHQALQETPHCVINLQKGQGRQGSSSKQRIKWCTNPIKGLRMQWNLRKKEKMDSYGSSTLFQLFNNLQWHVHLTAGNTSENKPTGCSICKTDPPGPQPGALWDRTASRVWALVCNVCASLDTFMHYTWASCTGNCFLTIYSSLLHQSNCELNLCEKFTSNDWHLT